MNDLLAAIAIAMILEGLMPFLSPKSWKEAVTKVLSLADNKLRIVGLLVMLVGVVLLNWVR